MHLNADLIRIDGGTQPRAELHNDVVNEYAERMRGGAVFPPVSVFYDGQDYWLADGFHRFHAWCRARPGQPIEVDVFQGTLDDARWHSYGVNQTHGLRRTNADKEQAVRRALQHPKALMLSNRRIAQHCGVTGNTVRRYRWELESQATVSPSPIALFTMGDPRPRMGLDGRIINTARIGSVQRQKARTFSFAGAGEQAADTSSVEVALSSDDPRTCARELLAQFPFAYLQKVFLNVFSLHRRYQPPKIAG